MIKEYDQLVKLILIGGSGVGKSSLLMQFAENKFTENYLTTIGVDFRFKTVKQDSRTIKFQIWDTAGQERFRTITSAYYKGADGIIMVYDMTDPGSVDDLENYWINQAYNFCDKSIKVLLLGNKCDCDRGVSQDRINKLAEKYGYINEEVSAKTGLKVYDSIKKFGIDIAKQKMEKLGISWFNTNSPTLGGNSSTTDNKQAPQQTDDKSSGKQPPKKGPQPKQPQTIKIGGKKGAVPSYQKKCC